MTRHLVNAALAVAMTLGLAAAALAAPQDPPPATGTTGTVTSGATAASGAAASENTDEGNTQPMPARSMRWASIGGFEIDSNEMGYGFFGPQLIRPLRDNVSFIGSANLNYLFYEYDNPDGSTRIRSPGVSLMGGLMFGEKNWFSIQAGPSFKRRQVRSIDLFDNTVGSDSDLDVGFNVGTSVWVDPTSHNNIFAMFNYDTVDRYAWGRLAFKEQLGNRSWQGTVTPYAGVEFIAQGNDDIRSRQYGGFVEFAHVPSSVSVMLRAGWKRSSFDFGDDKTGPWFAVGFYHRLR